jgi:hypothetical protein
MEICAQVRLYLVFETGFPVDDIPQQTLRDLKLIFWKSALRVEILLLLRLTVDNK